MLRTQITPMPSTGLSRWSAAVRSLSWQEAAIIAYRQAERTDRNRLRQELASRIHELTGQSVDAGSISVDQGTRTATVTVGDVVFQLRQTALVLVRPCVHCGVGRCTSAEIACAVDLGHALAVWEPRCAACAWDDEDEDWSHSF